MNFRLVSVLTVAGLAVCASPVCLCAAETNLWPIWVQHTDSHTNTVTTTGWGPLDFEVTTSLGEKSKGFRPLWEESRSADEQQIAGSFAYPLAHWESDLTTGSRSWTIFNLLNFSSTPEEDTRSLDIWPFYFSRSTAGPGSSYRALLPIYGEVTHRFNQDHLQWVLFPLYGRFDKQGEITTTTPWPFIKTVSGEGHRGIEIWPLAGKREQIGISSESFALWPLLYLRESGLDSATPSLQAGLLPFYAIDRKPGYQSETYLWPFWGYVDRTEPYHYHARHYFWPLWVQGEGDDRVINRWAPFYAHSQINDQNKTWVMWPLWRQATWTDSNLDHDRRQFLYFLYHATTQSSRSNPNAPTAQKTHVWPLFSSWDNGAGQKQFQAFSPIEVFLPHQVRTRHLWSPLFAIYRFNQTAPGESRHAFLWNALTYARSEANDTREFHFGPLFEYSARSTGRRIGLLAGLIGLERSSPHHRWRPHFGRPSSPSVSPTP